VNPLWIVQALAVLQLEMKKTFFSRRGIWIYLLALAPAALFIGHSVIQMRLHFPCDFGNDTNIFATTFQVFYLRLAVFFGCIGIFMNLFRGEVLDKSLHYYFLAPIRREVLLVGKFMAGLLATTVIFTTSTCLQIFGVYLHHSGRIVQDYLVSGNGISHILSYLTATVLACVGYGSVFLAAGVLVRNPLIPAGVMLIWESISSFLPSILQKFSVIYYLKSLCPIQIDPHAGEFFSMLSINANPMPAPIAILGLLLLAVAVLVIASFKVRRMEINYATE
jgi:ABC-type transport system involved in multi-copper enzyme maturation permease subunit